MIGAVIVVFVVNLFLVNFGYASIAAPLFNDPEVVFSVEVDERVYFPVDVTWDSSGTGYLLLQGSCRLLIIDKNFDIVGEIGSCGDGPGELGDAKSVEIVGDSIFVFQGHRLDVFASNGTPIGRSTFEIPIIDTAVQNGIIFGTNKTKDHVLVQIEGLGKVVEGFGPECEGENWHEKYYYCGNSMLFEYGENLIIVDPVAATVFYNKNLQWRVKNLGIPSGKTWNKGGAAYSQSSVVSMCSMPDNNKFLLLYRDLEKGDYRICILNHAFKIETEHVVQSEPPIRKVLFSPNGQLWVLYWHGEVKVFKKGIFDNSGPGNSKVGH